jgi:hypothetical protein
MIAGHLHQACLRRGRGDDPCLAALERQLTMPDHEQDRAGETGEAAGRDLRSVLPVRADETYQRAPVLGAVACLVRESELGGPMVRRANLSRGHARLICGAPGAGAR